MTWKPSSSGVSIRRALVRRPIERHGTESSSKRRKAMRVMVIVKATKNSEAGALPDQKLLAEMGNFNEQLVKAGVMLAGEGLHPSSKGKRGRFEGSKRTITDGPFAETKELIAGFWILQAKDWDEVLEWVKRCPMDGGTEL